MIELKDIPDTLPDSLHELMALVMQDVKKCLQDERYDLEMGDWHDGCGTVCYVCMAGAIMAQTLKTPVGMVAEPYMYDDSLTLKLWAVNNIRVGRINVACRQTPRYTPQNPPDRLKVEEATRTYVDMNQTFYNKHRRHILFFPDKKKEDAVKDWVDAWDGYVGKLKELDL